MSNVTVEDALNRLVTISVRPIWIVTFTDDTHLTGSGFRRAATLFSKSPVPDDQQPVWDLFHWGDVIRGLFPG
jgi:hypothetical protein